jgi:hypothetical protein
MLAVLMYWRARLRRSSSITSSKVVPLVSLSARAFACSSRVSSQHRASAPCHAAGTFAPRFRPKRASSSATFRAARRRVADWSKGVQQVDVFGSEWHGKSFIGENELIGRSAKFDQTATEPLKLREVRVEYVGQGYLCWVNIPARDFSQTIHHKRDSELGVLCSPKPRNANEAEFDDEVIGPSVNCTRIASFTIRQ